jgi:hypothetical protein
MHALHRLDAYSPTAGKPRKTPKAAGDRTAQESKVFWFLSTEKNKILLFLKKKKAAPALREAKRPLFSGGGLGGR